MITPNPTENNENTIGDFLSVIFEPTDDIEFRVHRPGQSGASSRWCAASEWKSQLSWLKSQNATGANVYVGANPRTKLHVRGDKNCALARTLFVDFDGGTTREDALARIAGAGLPAPSIVVQSGHGIHCYWLLANPCTDWELWKAKQCDLIAALGSDPVIKNPERIMRLPGFVNHKPPAAEAILLHVDNAARFDIAAFPDDHAAPTPAPDAEPTADAAEMPPVTDRPSAPDHIKAQHWTDHYIAQAATGNRNAVGLKLGRQLRDDADLPLADATPYMQEYQSRVTTPSDPYTLREAMDTLRQIYSRPRGEPAVSRAAADAPATPATPTASAPALKLSYVDISKCREPRPSAWIVPGWLPARQVAGFGANGGTGKSTWALQEAAALAIGAAFLGDAQEPMRCLYHSAEDGPDVVLPRLERICDALAVPPEELAKNLRIINAEDNPTLVEPAAKTLKPVTTRIYALLAAAVQQWQPRLIVIDGASDTFDGDENSRRDVRTYIHALRRLAAISRAGVLLIMHVNRRAAEGGKTDQHFSGSTAWNNSVRSRLALVEDDFCDTRLTLLHEKSNLGPRQKPKTFSRDPATGLFVPMHADAVDTTDDQRAILRIFCDFSRRGEKIYAATSGPHTAYRSIAGEPGFPPKIKKSAFDRIIRAMERTGYIARTAHENDHRHVTQLWKVTPLGELFSDGKNDTEKGPKIDLETGEILEVGKNENP